MTRCEQCKDPVFVDRLAIMCEKDPYTYSEMRRQAEYFQEHPEIAPLSGGAIKPLMCEKDAEVEAKALETLGSQCSRGNVATAKQVKIILSNIRDRVPTKGGDHKGAIKQKGGPGDVRGIGSVDPIRSPAVVLLPGGNDEPGDEPEDLDTEEDYYTGDIEGTPDTHENLETQKADAAVPPDVADIEAKMEEKRVAQAVKDLQKQKEDERQKQKDEMEYAALKEKNGNVQLLDELVSDLVTAFRAATAKGMPNDLVSDAINLALTAAFPGVQKPGETDDPATSGRLFK